MIAGHGDFIKDSIAIHYSDTSWTAYFRRTDRVPVARPQAGVSFRGDPYGILFDCSADAKRIGSPGDGESIAQDIS